MSASVMFAEETYFDVSDMLDATTKKFMRRFNRFPDQYEELRADANTYYLEAYRSFRSDGGLSFRRWVFKRVWFGLLDSIRKEAFRAARLKKNPLPDENELPTHQQKFSLLELLDELSEDARTIVELVLDPPLDVRLHVECRRQKKTTRNNVVASFREYLRDLGWSARRIADSFDEISAAL